MAKDQEVLTGVVERFYHASGNRPAKLIVADGGTTFELTVYPAMGVEQPWTEQTQLPALMDNLPADLVGVTIQAIAEPKGEYNSVPQYKPTKITVLDGNAAAPAAPAQAPKYLAGPNNPVPYLTDRDTLIVDQVIFKGAIDLLRGDITVAQAVESAIEAWESVRARHLANRYSVDDILESEGDFGSL